MGNSQSQTGGNTSGEDAAGPTQLDYYDLLGVDEEAGDDGTQLSSRAKEIDLIFER
jgi:hypothetical protein